MVMTANQAVDLAGDLLKLREDEVDHLDKIRDYVRGKQEQPWLPNGATDEMRKLAAAARVNVLRYVVNAPTQALYVDGYRSRAVTVDDEGESAVDEGATDPVWDIWRANRMTARQVPLHRGTLTYGASYAIVLPGEPTVSIRCVSPRRLTVGYGDDTDWPDSAIERRRKDRWRLFDDEAAYTIARSPYGGFELIGDPQVHGAGVVPVVRYLAADDLDGDVVGIVEPLFELQDQVNLTTYLLLVAQHYGAHRQRYVTGWMADSAQEALKASAQQLWTFEDDDVKVGEFEQTILDGYINSREASLRHVATISQTPVHELLGSIANLSAEALVAARDSHNRALEEWRTLFGESHLQTLDLAAQLGGVDPVDDGWVRWRDVESRSLAQTADALGKLVQMLGIPAEALWDRVADALGVGQGELAEWKRLSTEGGDLGQLAGLLERQMAGAGDG